MSIEKRIVKLEEHTGAGKLERKTWVLVDGEPEAAGIAETDTVIYVVDEETKELMGRVKDRTMKLIDEKARDI